MNQWYSLFLLLGLVTFCLSQTNRQQGSIHTGRQNNFLNPNNPFLNQNQQSNNQEFNPNQQFGTNRPGGGQNNNRPRPTQRPRPSSQQTPNNPASSTTAGDFTTAANPNFQSCVARCASTPQYNPVCGSDGQTYHNMGRLECANFCGGNVRWMRNGTCTPLRK